MKENETGKKCPGCRNEAEEYLDYPTYKKKLNKRLITTALICCGGITFFGFVLTGFVLHWTLSVYTTMGFIAGIFYALNLERASLAEIAAAVREEMAEDEE